MDKASLSSTAPDAASDSQSVNDAAKGVSISLNRVELAFIWIFWGLIALLTYFNAMLDSPSSSAIRLPAIAPLISSVFKSLMWAVLTPFIFRLANHYRLEHPRWMLRVPLLLVVGTMVTIFITTVMDGVRYLQAVYFTQGSAALWNLDLGALNQIAWRFWVMNEFVVYLLILAAGYAYDYFVRYRTRSEQASALQAQAVQLRAELANSQLNALRAQINPHFLFNTLNAVSSLIDDDPLGAQRMLAQLSGLLRDTLSGNDLEVTLGRELAFMRRYIDIMRTRFEDRLQAVEVIAPETLNALVPNLILQPLVENAIKHGIDKLDGGGRIEIRAQRQDEMLLLRVIDNGAADPVARLQEPHTGGGLGLKNTRARLAQSYGERHTFSLRSVPGTGIVAEIALPFHTTPCTKSPAP